MRQELPSRRGHTTLAPVDTGVYAAHGLFSPVLDAFIAIGEEPETFNQGQQVARKYFDGRARILAEVNPIIHEEALETARSYDLHIRSRLDGGLLTKGVGGESLEPDLTVSRYAQLRPAVSNTLNEIWQVGTDTAVSEQEFAKVFEWNFDRLKRVSAGVGSKGRPGAVVIAKRYDQIDGLDVLYPLHTHVDVPYAMYFAGVLRTPLDLFVAFGHDSIEEGRNLVFAPSEVTGMLALDAQTLREHFPRAQLGDKMGIAIRAMTESEYPELLARVGQYGIGHLEEWAADSLKVRTQAFVRHSDRVHKIVIQDPLVFGGLAMQIPMTVKELAVETPQRSSLKRFSYAERIELAEAIIAGEIGDRMSDISTLHGDVEWFVDDRDFAAYKTTAYAARHLNTADKMLESVGYLPADRRAPFEKALDLYVHVLRRKIAEIDSMLVLNGHRGLKVSTIDSFMREEFLPAQREAEKVLRKFVQGKVHAILDGVEF